MRLIQRYFALSRARRTALHQTCLVFLLLRLLTGRLALKRIIRFLSSTGKKDVSSVPHCELNDILWSIHAVNHRLPGATCLMNAIAAKYLLKKHCIDAQLLIGVRKDSTETLKAHAWVTVDQKIVLGDVENISEYIPLPKSRLLKL